MRVVKKLIKDINLAEYNPRINLMPGDPVYEKIKNSIVEFNLVEPLIWNERTGNLVSGHQRLRILQDLGHTEVEVSIVNLDKNKEKILNLSLNKINGLWDHDKLQGILGDIEFDIELTGFSREEIEDILKENVPYDINDILEDIDVNEALEKPLWVVIRADEYMKQSLDQVIKLAKNTGFRVETSYD